MRVFSKMIAVSALVVALAPAAASAVVVTLAPADLTVGDKMIEGTVTKGTVFQNVQGTQVNSGGRTISATPFAGSGLADTGFFTSVQGRSALSYDFGGEFNALNLLWGTPDETPVASRNQIDFFLKDVLVATVTALSIATDLGLPGNNLGRSDVTITGLTFDTAVFSNSSSNAFEFAQLEAAVVPLPAPLALLLAGLGGLALVSRRKAV